MKILTSQAFVAGVVLISILSLTIACSSRNNNVNQRSGIKSKKLRYFLADYLADDKDSVSRVYATHSVGGATVWDAKASSSYRPNDNAKEMDSASWKAISKLLSNHLERLSRDEIGTHAPSHYVYINAEFCQIKIPVYRTGESGSYDIVGELVKITGGSEGMNWNPVSDDTIDR